MNTAIVAMKLGYFNVSFFIINCQLISSLLSFNHCFFGFSLTDERVPSDLKKGIMQARMDKKLTQAQLAQV
jgi:hypothetical protein